MSEYGQSVMHTRSEVDTLLEKSSCTLEQLFDVEELLQQCSNKNHTLIEFLEKPENIKKLILYITRPSEENIEMVQKEMNTIWDTKFDDMIGTGDNSNSSNSNNSNNNSSETKAGRDNDKTNSNENKDDNNSSGISALLDPPQNDNGVLITKQNKNKNTSNRGRKKEKPLVWSADSDLPPPPPPPPGDGGDDDEDANGENDKGMCVLSIDCGVL